MMSASPVSWEKRLIEEYAFQAAFHSRGVAAVRGVASDMVFAVIEMCPPYALSVLACAPSLIAMAEVDVEEAIALWAECMATNTWPGYPPEIAWVEAPSWAEMRQQERTMRNEFLRDKRQANDGEVYQRLFAAAGGPPR